MVSALQKPCANAARRCGGFRHLVAYAPLGNTASSKLVIKVSLLSSSLNSRQGMFCRFFVCSTNKQEFHKWRFITQQ